MAFVLTILLVVIPLIELFVIISVSHVIGGAATLLLLILCCAAGAWVVKHEGLAALRRIQAALREGRVPAEEVTDGGLVLLAGVLLLLPGFITSFLGALLALGPVRTAARRMMTAVFLARVARRFPPASGAPRGGQPSGPPPGRRPYRRTDEPDPMTDAPGGAWRTRVRSPGATSDDVIDVDGEEIEVPYGAEGELGPSDS